MELQTIYIFCLILGGGFFIVASLLGDLHHDHLGGDVGGFGHGIEHFFDAHGFHLGDEHGTSEAVNPLNLRNIFAFLAGFGLVGTVMTVSNTTLSLTQSLLFSIPAGLIFGAFSWGVLVFMVTRQATSQAKADDYVGRVGTLIVGIREGGSLGEVQAVIKGQVLSIPARSYENQAIPKGTKVQIIEYEKGGIVRVEEFEKAITPSILR
jgi:hypothetical protein